MHKKNSMVSTLGRQQSQIGWRPVSRQRKIDTLGELTQLHMSIGKGHHFARSFKGHDKHWRG
ncbi:MAG: hypothetical protein ABH859_04785 [Pseudomonadota bacterium]